MHRSSPTTPHCATPPAASTPPDTLLLVQTTCADEAEAERLAQSLLERRLAACVLIEPVQSRYCWQGQMQCSLEQRLSIKTLARHWRALEAAIVAAHSYEVPMVIASPIVASHAAYAAWLREQA